MLICLYSEYGSKISYKIRIIGGFLLQAIILLIIPRRSQLIDGKVMIGSYALIGINTAIVNCSILGFMNILDVNYQQITLSGQAFAGVIASILRMVTRYIYPSDIHGLEDATQIFFDVGSFYCLMCAVLFLMIGFNDYIQYKKNIFFISIAGYFSSIRQEITDRTGSINSISDPEHDGDIMQKKRAKARTMPNAGTNTQGQPLELHVSESFINPANPYAHSTASEQYQKMSSSFTNFSVTKTIKKISKSNTNMKTPSKDTISSLRPSEQRKVLKTHKKDEDRHLTLTHLAALQNQRPNGLSLYETNQQKIYITGAMLDLIKSDRKRRVRQGTHPNDLFQKKKRNKENGSDLNKFTNSNTKSVDASRYSAKSMFTKLGLFNMAYRLYPKIKWFCFAILLLNILTWSIFPGLISGKIKSEFNVISENQWMSIILAMEFFVFNFIGRLILSSFKFCNCILCCCRYDRDTYKGYVIVSCCHKKNLIINAKVLIWFCAIRIIMIYPIFILVYVGVFGDFNLNWISHILMGITGLTHGCIYCIVIMGAPQFVAKHHREAAVSILRFFHFSGVLIGSSIALGVSFIVGQ